MAIKVFQIAAGGLDSNFSYLAIAGNGDALIVDPCGDAAKIREPFDKALPLKPKYILLTHGHGDHFDALDEIRGFFNAPLVGHPDCKAPCEIRVEDGELLPFGGASIKCLHTPGHSRDGVCYELDAAGALFTGDTLFIDCCGYCEPAPMFKTMREKLWPLPDSLLVFSGHDYGHVKSETLGMQKLSNPYLKAETLEDFKCELKNL